jgi:hypothetical protein
MAAEAQVAARVDKNVEGFFNPLMQNGNFLRLKRATISSEAASVLCTRTKRLAGLWGIRIGLTRNFPQRATARRRLLRR